MANKNKKIIHNLYSLSNKYNKRYSDDKWETVYELFNELKKSNGIIDGTLSGGVYKNYFSNSEIPSRIYNVVFETEFGTNIIGTITCSAAGTFEEPFYPYDIYCNFSEETLNESKNVDFAKKNNGQYKYIICRKNKAINPSGIKDIARFYFEDYHDTGLDTYNPSREKEVIAPMLRSECSIISI